MAEEPHSIGKEGEGRWMKNRNLLKLERSTYKRCSFRAPPLRNLKNGQMEGCLTIWLKTPYSQKNFIRPVVTGSFDRNYLTVCYKTISFDRNLFATGQVVFEARFLTSLCKIFLADLQLTLIKKKFIEICLNYAVNFLFFFICEIIIPPTF